MTVTVRRASLGDAQRLAQINVDAWRAAYTGLVPQVRLDGMQVDTYRARWLSTLGENDGSGRLVLVAQVDGVVSTYCAGGPYRPQEDAAPEETGTWGEIYAIYTDPLMQGQGAGTAVHDAFLDDLHNRGFEQAALWVLQTNQRARGWYTSRGWRPDGAVADWVSEGVAHPETRLRISLPHRAP